MAIEPDEVTIISTLIHDTVSDGSATFPEIEKAF